MIDTTFKTNFFGWSHSTNLTAEKSRSIVLMIKILRPITHYASFRVFTSILGVFTFSHKFTVLTMFEFFTTTVINEKMMCKLKNMIIFSKIHVILLVFIPFLDHCLLKWGV